MLKRGLAVAGAALALASVAGASDLPLTARLAQALAVPGVAAGTSAAVAVDLRTGATVFARNPDVALVPASNEKLTVTYAALIQLGPAYRFRTEVLGLGRQEGDVWVGDIFLKGFGDPTLTSRGLDRLALQLRRLGISRVTGRVIGDESWFDSIRTGPGWKPDFFLEESPALSALVVDGGIYDHHPALKPALAAAGRFKQMLRARQIAAGRVAVGRAPANAVALAEITSQPLTAVLREMDTDSDNFTAEMLLKTLGAEIRGVGSTAAGATVVIRTLANAEIPLAGVRIADGSGLSEDDRVTAQALVALLVDIWNVTALRARVWPALAVAGISGTLKDRMQRPPLRGAVHAKTGTTDLSSALAGYVRERYAFVVIDNGRPVRWSAARKSQDRFVGVLARAALQG